MKRQHLNRAWVLLLALLLPLGLSAQTQRVRGVVTGDSGDPLPGVVIVDQASGRAASTETDGSYTIEAGKDAVLQFLLIGYKSQEVPVEGRTVLNVVLEEDITLLDSGVRMCKWEYEDGLSYQAMSNDFPIYRLADVYLLKAEALMRQNGGTANASAVELANRVRSRAGATAYTTSTLTLDELLEERARELCWEGHRRQDQVRFGTYSKPWDNKTNTDSYRDIYPIPQRAMTTNANLKQNPGY